MGTCQRRLYLTVTKGLKHMTSIPQNTIEVPLSRGYVTIIDDIDANLAQHKWHVVIPGRKPYAQRNLYSSDGKHTMQYLHRLIMECVLDRPLFKTEEVDHRDCNGLNNCRANLRLATRTQNARNTRISKRNTSGFKGVSYSKFNSKWTARLYLNGHYLFLGYFDSPEEAADIYRRAVLNARGEFARYE